MSPPKVLILNQPFNSNTGGGITLSNLFQNWENDQLAVACSGYLLNSDTDFNRCNNYYQLGSEERTWIFPFNLISRSYYSGAIHTIQNEALEDKVVLSKSTFKSRLAGKLQPLFDYSGFSYFQATTGLSPKFCKWMDSINPDVLYVQANIREDILLAIQVCDYLKIPMVFHMMDDWPMLVGLSGLFSNYWKNKIDTEFRILIGKANLLMGISDYMCEEYEKRYQKPFITFHNPINLNFWKRSQRHIYELPEYPTILYAGRLGLGIDSSLKTIADAIELVNKELFMNVKFAVQAQDAPEWIRNHENIVLKGFVKYDELPGIFSKADLLILPYDFSAESLSYIKYSMPTKAPEYMASGTPIAIFAPQDTALVQYAEKFKWAEVVVDDNTRVLADRLKELFSDRQLREKIANNAKRIAETRHDAAIVAQKFQDVLSNVVDK